MKISKEDRKIWFGIASGILSGVISTVIVNGLGALIEQVGGFSFLQSVLIFLIVSSSVAVTFFIARHNSKANNFLTKEEKKIYDRMGISGYILETAEGEGGPKKILEGCRSNFSFMGSGGYKWTMDNKKELKIALRRITNAKQTARFILLNPMCKEAGDLQHITELNNKESILESIKSLWKMKKSGLRLEVKLYSTARIFRIAIIDDKRIYLGSYDPIGDNAKRPQLLLEGSGEKILYEQFKQYYDVVWNSKELKEVDFERLSDEDFENPEKSDYWNGFKDL